MASSGDKTLGDDEHQDGKGSNAANSNSDDEEAEESSSDATSQSSHSSSESDDEMPACTALPVKDTEKGTSTKEDKMGAPNSSELPPDADNKVTEAEQKCQ